MTTTIETNTAQSAETQRPFSLPLYLLIVFGLSWPFQIAYAVWGNLSMLSFLLTSLSMVMVAVGSFIAGRFVFRDGFREAGWSWGKPKHYLAALALALFIFGVPVLLEAVLGLHVIPIGVSVGAILSGFAARFVLTLIPGFGEEFGWRGYMLPRLAQRYSLRRALLLHAFIWWAWHIPALVGIGARVEEANSWLWIGVTLLVSLIPSMMNATLYAYVWAASGSLAVASVYHAAYDEVRDALEQSIGFGPLVSLWEMAVTTLIGAALLWKGKWSRLEQPGVPSVEG